MKTPIVKVVSNHFILIDSFTPTNSIRLHLPEVLHLFNYLIKSRDEAVYISIITALQCILMDHMCIVSDVYGIVSDIYIASQGYSI